jgi:hypothetical protein
VQANPAKSLNLNEKKVVNGLLGVHGDEDLPADRLFGAAKPSRPFSVTNKRQLDFL